MSGLAIVAIPQEGSPVWKYSSEKVPHLTLLYLGEDVEDIIEITQFVEHAAATSLNKFWLSVDRRGTLGPDLADVLFFKQDDYDFELIKKFRSDLLGDRYIRESYESTFQYPKWTPHLTMGYPDTPALKDDREYPGFQSVAFDRISVWVEDYKGPTFNLKERNDMELAMSDRVDDFIAHFGVKGMRWGVRRTDAQLGNPDGGKNGVKDSDGVDIDKSKLADGSPLKSRDPDGIDNPKDIVVSEDAIRFVQTTLKEGHEMSTREINEAIKRADAVAKYNEKLNPDQYDIAIKQAQAARARVDALKADEEYRIMTTPPSKLERVTNLIGRANTAWQAYSSFNDTLGGVLPDPLAAFKKAKQDAEDLGLTDSISGRKKSDDDDGPKLPRAQRKANERQEKAQSKIDKRVAKQKSKDDTAEAKAAAKRTELLNQAYKRQAREKKEAERQAKAAKAATPPTIPATQAAPPRPPTPFRLPPAPPTVTTPRTVTSDRPYGGAYPNLGPYGTHVRHEDVSKLVAKFSDVSVILD